jgi:hypothetical protein
MSPKWPLSFKFTVGRRLIEVIRLRLILFMCIFLFAKSLKSSGIQLMMMQAATRLDWYITKQSNPGTSMSI